MISIGSGTIIERGMPGGRHDVRLMPAGARAGAPSDKGRYLGVSGACCPRPGGLDGSQGVAWPRSALIHDPLRSGYLPSSCAKPDAVAAPKAVTSATAPMMQRLIMISSLFAGCVLVRGYFG